MARQQRLIETNSRLIFCRTYDQKFNERTEIKTQKNECYRKKKLIEGSKIQS